MSQPICSHLPDVIPNPVPNSDGCSDCIALGKSDWVHLRLCQICGQVGCCDNSVGRHATAHFHQTEHPLIRSFEPGEDWWWCYLEEIVFMIPDAPPAPSYP